MNVVQLTDGLGNQLFQYAFAVALQNHTGRNVLLDCSWFPEFGGKLRKAVPRPYALGGYDLSLVVASQRLTQELIYGKGMQGWLRKLLHIKRGLIKGDSVPNPLECADNYVIKGFFQQARYAESVRERLLRDLTLPDAGLPQSNLAILESIRSQGERAVCVHIRRGDYTTAHSQQVHGLCSADYYRRAEEYIATRTNKPLHLFIFSDDPDWVRENYHTPHPFTCVSVNSAADGFRDINLMSHCRHAIIANSSFSWWGAWLIANPQKMVVAPQQWRADGFDTSGLLPDSWMAL